MEENKIDLDAIIKDSKIATEMYGTNISYFSLTSVKILMKEAINQALVLASERASLIHCYPLEDTKDEPVKEEKDIEDNYEGKYKSPYQNNGGDTIWVDKQSILEVEKLII